MIGYATLEYHGRLFAFDRWNTFILKASSHILHRLSSWFGSTLCHSSFSVFWGNFDYFVTNTRFCFKEKAILSLIRVYFHCYQNLLSNRPKEFFCMSTCRKRFVLPRSLRYFLSQFLVQIKFCKNSVHIL